MKYKSDIEKMQVALAEAKKALEIDEVPIGAALFDNDDKLITKAHNRREIDQDPTAHAEILVIKEASQILKTWRLENTTLAITLLYSSPNLKSGAAYTLYNIPQDKRLNHFVEIRDNILSHESEVILSSFFESKR